MTLTVAIYLFPDVEVLDFAGPYEVFTTAARVHARRQPEAPPLFRVFTVATTGDPVRARAGLEVNADYIIDTHPRPDVLIIPGGVVDAETDKPEVIRWIAAQATQARITAVESDLCQELGRAPRPSEIAERLECDLDLVVEALAANGCFAPTSLDATPGDVEEGIGDRLGGEDESFDSAEARVALKPLLAHLDRRERIMLEMRFFKGATQSEIGEVLGITQMQVSRLLSALLAFSVTRWYPLSLLLMAVTGFGILATTVSISMILQTLVEDRVRGRVMSLYTAAFLGVAPLGGFAAGAAADRIGAPTTIAIGGACCALAGLVLGYRRKALSAAVASGHRPVRS